MNLYDNLIYKSLNGSGGGGGGSDFYVPLQEFTFPDTVMHGVWDEGVGAYFAMAKIADASASVLDPVYYDEYYMYQFFIKHGNSWANPFGACSWSIGNVDLTIEFDGGDIVLTAAAAEEFELTVPSEPVLYYRATADVANAFLYNPVLIGQ